MLRAAMRASSGPVASKGGVVSGSSGAQEYQAPDDRTECKYCGRKFAEITAIRHIPVCEKKYKEQQMKSKGKPSGGNMAPAR